MIISYSDDVSVDRMKTHEQGFTLIEMLVVMAILAVLPTMIVPAIQAAREAAAHSEASVNLNQLIAASQEYHNRQGSYPRRIDDLVGWNFTPLDQEVAQGKKNGYLYEIVESNQSHCRIEAKPEYVGITGSLCLGAVIGYSNVQTYQILSAGADAAKERVFNNICTKAAETAARLLIGTSAASQVRDYVQSPEAVNDVFNALDGDSDGKINVEEMVSSPSAIRDGELRGPLDQFLAYVAREMKFDSLSEEQKRAIHIPDGNLRQTSNASLFSYDRVRLLTRVCINQADISNSLCVKLDDAAAAEASGDLQGRNRNILRYQDQVRSQIGQVISGSDAQTLITLTDVIKAR